MAKWNNSYIYTPVKGRVVDTLPNVRAKGGSILGGNVLTGAQAMDRKIEVAKSWDEELIKTWFGCDDYDNGFFVLTPIFFQKNGNAKIGDLNNQRVRDYLTYMTNSTVNETYGGLMGLPQNFNLDKISGTEFTFHDLMKYAGHSMTANEAKKNLILKAIANNDDDRLEAFVESTHKIAGTYFKHQDELISVKIRNNIVNYHEHNVMGVFRFGGIMSEGVQVDGSLGLNNNPESIIIKVRLTESLVSKLDRS
jgi:hypothetical protein